MSSVSVVIATYNYGHWIKRALDSVLAQTVPVKEIVVCNDGSTDNTCKILEDLCPNWIRSKGINPHILIGDIGVPLKILHFGDNRGPAFARNRAIEQTSGEIIGILDADDRWFPNRVETCLKPFERPEVSLVYTDYETEHPDGTVFHERKQSYSREALLASCVVTNACFIRRSHLDKVGLYDETLRVAEDYDLFLRLSECSLLWHIPEFTIRLGISPQNTTNSHKKEMWDQALEKVIAKLKERIGLK